MIQQMIADNEIDLAASRAPLIKACHELDVGKHASDETSIAKPLPKPTCASSTAASRCAAGSGVSEDLPLAGCRPSCGRSGIYDGPRRCIAGRSPDAPWVAGVLKLWRRITGMSHPALDSAKLYAFLLDQGVEVAAN